MSLPQGLPLRQPARRVGLLPRPPLGVVAFPGSDAAADYFQGASAAHVKLSSSGDVSDRMLDSWWPAPMPLPYTYYCSVSPILTYAQHVYYTALSWLTIPPASGYYFLPLSQYTTTGFTQAVSSGTRTRTFTVWNAAGIYVSIPANDDVIAVTITVGGTGGYTADRSYAVRGLSLQDIFTLPTPWDELRTITVAWTGGGTSADIYAVRIGGILVRQAIPSGWDAAGFTGRYAAGKYLTEARSATDPIPESDGTTVALTSKKGGSFTTTGVRFRPGTVDAAAIIGNEAASVSDTAYGFPSPASRFAPYIGIPCVYNGEHYRALSHFRPPLSLSSAVFSGSSRVISAHRFIVVYLDCIAVGTAGTPPPPNAPTITVKRAADWGAGTPTITLATITPVVGLNLLLSDVIPFTDGSLPGQLTITLDNCSGYVVAVSEAPPLPVDLVATDGVGIPGATHSDARIAAGGWTAVQKSGLVFAATDVPALDTAFVLQFTGLTTGLYYVPTGYVGTELASAENCYPANAIVVLVRGGTIYCMPPTTWGKIGNPDSPGSLASLTLVGITVTPYALAAGVNILDSKTKWGVPGSAYDPTFAFVQWTAPSDGTYEFALTITSGSHYLLFQLQRKIAVWASLTDPYCAHVAPDAIEDARFDHVAGDTFTPYFVATTIPPTSDGTGRSIRYMIGPSATGAWAGRDGQIAQAVHCPAAGQPLDWRFLDPPDGVQARVSGIKVHKRTGATWVERSAPTYRVTLTAGQTIYLRFGSVYFKYPQLELGCPIYYSTSVRVTVSSV